jgi:hypothetical protein
MKARQERGGLYKRCGGCNAIRATKRSKKEHVQAASVPIRNIAASCVPDSSTTSARVTLATAMQMQHIKKGTGDNCYGNEKEDHVALFRSRT